MSIKYRTGQSLIDIDRYKQIQLGNEGYYKYTSMYKDKERYRYIQIEIYIYIKNNIDRY